MTNHYHAYTTGAISLCLRFPLRLCSAPALRRRKSRHIPSRGNQTDSYAVDKMAIRSTRQARWDGHVISDIDWLRGDNAESPTSKKVRMCLSVLAAARGGATASVRRRNAILAGSTIDLEKRPEWALQIGPLHIGTTSAWHRAAFREGRTWLRCAGTRRGH